MNVKLTLVLIHVIAVVYFGALALNKGIDTVTSYRAMQVSTLDALEYELEHANH